MGSVVANYVELDLPYCAETFGESPCTATGVPCFNTRNLSHDCGDPDNYNPTTITVRFAEPNGYEYWPNDPIFTLPILGRVSSSSAKIMPAENMGTRATCNISLKNGLSTMAGLDKNIIARDNDFQRGTFLGKFKARFPYIFGSAVRVYRGTVGGAFTVEHYTIDDFSGPNNSGGMQFKCVDFLKLTNGKSSQFPAPTEGVLIADIDAVATTLTIEPAGIGDIQYPASGRIAVGKEGMDFARVGDVFTITRGIYGVAEPHKVGDNVQLVGEYSAQTSADIIYDLIVNYTPLDASYIDLAAWQSEITDYQSALYSAQICRPEPVSKLINEIIEQAGLIFYADVKTKKIILKVLRPIISGKTLDDDLINGFSQKENQGRRVSQVWTYYNQKNPLEKLDDESNFYSAVISPSVENLYPTEVIKKVFSRWIPAFSQSVALDLNSRILERYINPPRDFDFNLFVDNPIELGQGVYIDHPAIEDAFGDKDRRPAYITSVDFNDVYNTINAQEFYFTEYTGIGGGGNILITIDENIVSKSLRSIYDSAYSSIAGVISVTFVIRSGTFFGGENNGVDALSVGDFGAITPKLIIESGAYILGAGGSGGAQRNGGDALNADYPINIDNQGTISGGGGAGGDGDFSLTFKAGTATQIISGITGGAAGAGYNEGVGIYIPIAEFSLKGHKTTGQTVAEYVAHYEALGDLTFSNMTMGSGGGLAQNGVLGSDGAGGLPGKAVKGNSNINWLNAGTILGAIE